MITFINVFCYLVTSIVIIGGLFGYILRKKIATYAMHMAYQRMAKQMAEQMQTIGGI